MSYIEKDKVMVQAVVKDVFVTRDEVEPEDYIPSNPEHFGVWCIVYFGNTENDGKNYHRLIVCSPTWISSQFPEGRVLRGQGIVMMSSYDGRRLRSALSDFATRCFSETREGLYRKLERLGFSEFEDYNETPLPPFFMDLENTTTRSLNAE